MMPYCDWKRCKNVAERMIDLKCDGMRPWLCTKHFSKLMKLMGQGEHDE